MKIEEDFRLSLGGGITFSSKEAGFIFIGHEEYARKGEQKPPLNLYRHRSFIAKVIGLRSRHCLWIVENTTDKAKNDLRMNLPAFIEKGHSTCGYIPQDKLLMDRFLELAWQNYELEPWANEEGWILTGLNDQLPEPAGKGHPALGWTDLLQHATKVECAFMQTGWFACVMFRPFDKWEFEVEQEFSLVARYVPGSGR